MGLPLFSECVIFRLCDWILGLLEIVGEEEDRLGLWWRKCWVDGFDIQESL